MKTISMLLSWMPEVQRMLHDKSVIADAHKSFPVIPKRWWELDPGHWLWMEGFLTSHFRVYEMCLFWKKKGYWVLQTRGIQDFFKRLFLLIKISLLWKWQRWNISCGKCEIVEYQEGRCSPSQLWAADHRYWIQRSPGTMSQELSSRSKSTQTIHFMWIELINIDHSFIIQMFIEHTLKPVFCTGSTSKIGEIQ